MTLAQIYRALQTAFGSVPNVSSTTINSLEWDLHKDSVYPSVAFDLQNTTISDGTETYNFIITAANLGSNNESEADRVTNYDMLQKVLYQGLYKLESANDEIELPESYNFEFGRLVFHDVLDAVSVNIGLITSIDVDCTE